MVAQDDTILGDWTEFPLENGRKKELILLLEAMDIPFIKEGTGQVLVPASQLDEAAAQWRSYLKENRNWPFVMHYIMRPGSGGNAALLMFTIMIVFGILQLSGGYGLLAPKQWIRSGSANAWFMAQGELWRCLTALTLHSTAAHWFSNLVAILFWGFLVGGTTGAGVCLLLFTGSGALGNALTAFWHIGLFGELHNSVGASTGIFGLIGVLVTLAWRVRLQQTNWRRLLPFMAGAAILAFMGQGPRVDFHAHAFGLISGALLGFLIPKEEPSSRSQVALASISVIAFVAAWFLAA